MNDKIDPILYNFYLRLNDTLGAKIVHRRRRKSSTCIEVVFYNDLYKHLHGRLNTLKEAEACGYWVVCRLQTKRDRSTWRNRTVYQLYLTPVHPKKRHEAKRLAEANQVTFEPVMPKLTLRNYKTRAVPSNYKPIVRSLAEIKIVNYFLEGTRHRWPTRDSYH